MIKDIRAGICDDDRVWCSRAERIIDDYAEAIEAEIETVCFGDREQLFSYTGAPLEVLFMDISLRDDNGIEVAKAVNERWKHCQIVYLTNYLHYATEVYATEHIFFALKEQFEQRIGEIFGKVFHELEQKKPHLVFSVIGGKELILAPEDILYFERVRRVTVIETVWGRYEIWDKMDEIQEMLPKIDFVRCHNSYIVYLPAVREMLKNAFLLKNGAKVVISRSHLKNVKETFSKWARTQIS